MKIKMYSSSSSSLWLLLVASLLLVLVVSINGATSSSSSTPTKIGIGYSLISVEESPDGGIIGNLQVKQKNDIYGPDLPNLQLFVKHETEQRLRVHISDSDTQRWEVPYDLLPREKPPGFKEAISNSPSSSPSSEPKVCAKKPDSDPSKSQEYAGSEFIFTYTKDPFGFAVKRKSNGQTIFNSTAEESDPFNNLVFKDQYLEISTKLPENASIYGLGESSQPHGMKLYPGDPAHTMWNADIASSNVSVNLYGAHPVYMDLRNVKGVAYAHSVLLMNSNGMDVFYEGSSLTYKVIGGVLDFYFFSGPSPLEVIDQYTQLIGRPAPMPYWSFGFHQCKFGYPNISVVENVVDNYRKAQIPLDVMWTDDDHMDFHRDFTLNPVTFPYKNMSAFLERIHGIGMKYVVIIDPGINVNTSYGVYQRGAAANVFLKHKGKPFIGQVWPGPVSFPDYLDPKAIKWWADEIRRFHDDLVAVDGLWIDMNEISNFCNGDCTIPEGKQCPSGFGPGWLCCLDCKNITDTKWDSPPYKINASGIEEPIGYRTLATSVEHYNGVLEYDAHNIYGFTETIATHKALQGLNGKRPFILSRSTFVGSGKYAAHWTGDNMATWNDMKYSVTTMLNFGIFGIPMVGADICGFNPVDPSPKAVFDPKPTEELCNRWIELGAFYPFSRNHATFFSPGQELYRWKSVTISARNALGMRYKLLPYLYTLNYEAHLTGAPIARPLFFSFPNFTECYGLSTQFLLGTGLMVSPVLDPGKLNVKPLFPPGSWYNIFNMPQVVTSKGVEYVTLDAPLNVVNVHIYQNTIIPMQQGGLLSKEARTTPFTLVVAFPAGASSAEAKGNLFLDNDELPEMKLAPGTSTYVDFNASVIDGSVKIGSKVQEPKFALQNNWIVDNVIVLGLAGSGQPSGLEVNGGPISGSSNIKVSSSEHQNVGNNIEKSVMVDLKGLGIPIGKDFTMSWKMV